MTLQGTTGWVVPRDVIIGTEAAIREAGQAGHELFVLWSGVLNGRVFNVGHLHVPDQTVYRTDVGLGVRVEGPALHSLNLWLFEHHETLGAQLHSHPFEAYHSPTDDAYPIVTMVGSLSFVLAEFGRSGVISGDTACYRLTSSGFGSCGRTAADILTVI